MSNTTRSKAEAQFTATQKKDTKALIDREKVRQQKADQVSRLRALRLAKEAADKEAADKEAADKEAAKAKKKSSRGPHEQRRQS